MLLETDAGRFELSWDHFPDGTREAKVLFRQRDWGGNVNTAAVPVTLKKRDLAVLAHFLYECSR